MKPSQTYLTVAIAFALSSAFAQTGSIQGTVADPVGGVVPNARVVATDLDKRNIARETRTSRDGSFVLTPLLPGRYDLKVEMTGFKTLQSTNLASGGTKRPAESAPRTYLINGFNDYYRNIVGKDAMPGFRRLGNGEIVIKENNIPQPSATDPAPAMNPILPLRSSSPIMSSYDRVDSKVAFRQRKAMQPSHCASRGVRGCCSGGVSGAVVMASLDRDEFDSTMAGHSLSEDDWLISHNVRKRLA